MFLAILLSNAYQKQELPQECWNIRASKSYSIRKGLDLDSADPTETICEQDAIEWSGLPKQYEQDVNKMPLSTSDLSKVAYRKWPIETICEQHGVPIEYEWTYRNNV